MVQASISSYRIEAKFSHFSNTVPVHSFEVTPLATPETANTATVSHALIDQLLVEGLRKFCLGSREILYYFVPDSWCLLINAELF